MDSRIRILVKERVNSLFPVIRDHLNNHYELDQSLGSTFKYLYLCMYGPKRYLNEFSNGDLSINAFDVRDVFFDFAEHIPGDYGLQSYEESIIQKHNYEVKEYLNRINTTCSYHFGKVELMRLPH